VALRPLLSSFLVPITAALLASIPSAQTPPNPSPATAAAAQSRFPPGPGRDALFRVCNDCHGPESVLGQLKTHAEWSKTLDEMANNGAQGSEEEWNQILAYLDRNYSFIFVNKATAKDLESTLGVDAAIAEAIVGRRTDRGNYTSVEDLKQVPGVAAATIEARKDRFIF
jgi:competence protein ComEA